MLILNSKKLKTRDHYLKWRLLTFGVIALLFCGIIYTCVFMYKNIYLALATTDPVVLTNSNGPVFNLDIQSYDTAAAAIEKKINIPPLPANLKNIFQYDISTNTPDYAATNTQS